ncbi:MAG: deoxyribodipyrimidine photo-lyase [Oligoflexia bacterium]|nr:deoxyribodipyrimidine photo-lyase [Oligoflexia bacterium]
MIYERSLCWLRRDLRLTDNRALFLACEKSKQVFLAFVFDINILNKLSNKKDLRVEFIFNAIQSINQKLKEQNSQVLILYGNPVELIPALCKKLKLSAVFVNEDYENYAKQRDQAIKKQLIRQQTAFHSSKDQVIFNGSEIKKEDGSSYRVFTAYKKAWLKKLKPKEHLKEYRANLQKLSSTKNNRQKKWKLEDLGFQKTELNISSGEKSAQIQLKKFSQSIRQYHTNRDYPYLNKSSRLSVPLRFGALSIRECVRFALKQKSRGNEVWLAELIWREFYSMILDQFPYVEKKAFLKKYQNLKWSYSKKRFQAWCKGQTGFPIVDAGMRQLNQTGFMPNRIRMITASFLVKDLLIDWRKGEKYFAEKLLDFDLAANNGGWQWCAGVGCEAQPYFRIFNPITQSQKFDPKGAYIKSWVKELKNLNEKAVHFPMTCPTELPKGFQLGKNYPFPLVDHKTQRQKALKFFKKAEK